MIKKILFIFFVLLFIPVNADEGMWLVSDLSRTNINRMQQLGFMFDADKIYDEELPSLKDAVVIFGGGCTGVSVSAKGLIFTNHHCGYDVIQKHSSVEHNYLKDGFASQSFKEEIYTEGLTVKFLKKVKDITELFTETTYGEQEESVRQYQVDSISGSILEEYAREEFLDANIIPFFAGNKYYLMVYEVFKDVRMVLAPPSSIGKFGGETDNWRWPRQTGDFAVFRVYADSLNNPANYSPDNIPYKPAYIVPISVSGYKENSFAMTIGYPGLTGRYIPSWGIKQIMESENDPRIEVRSIKQEIWARAMEKSEDVHIKYASKFTRSANYWKNAIGMNNAIIKLDVTGRKQKQENHFRQWVESDSNVRRKYGEVLSLLENGYMNSMESEMIYTYFAETFFHGIELINFANYISTFNRRDTVYTKIEEVQKKLSALYKDYDADTDKQVTASLLKYYREKVPENYLPSIYKTIKKEFENDCGLYADWLFKNTQLKNIDSAIGYINNISSEINEHDPAIVFAKSVNKCYETVNGYANMYQSAIKKGMRLYIAGLMEMEPDNNFYSDANFTQRLSYGSVEGYVIADSIHSNYISTSGEMLEKANSGNPEYYLQENIYDILKNENWGKYTTGHNRMAVNFLSNNDITGGNSGSPVLNKNAELIGLAFDGNWESLSGDLLFEPGLQRSINVDIRYILFVIDKIMNCNRIIEELQIAE